MKRFNWAEMKEYWRLHSARWSGIDFSKDPEGLANVCIPGAPLWLNRHLGRIQKRVYKQLFQMIPPPVPGARALELGCGAGRWVRFLSEHGYQAAGIDLQPELIESNRKRHPDLEFHKVAIQDFTSPVPFDLISSVTVIQHIPFEEHDRILSKIRELLKPRGYVLILENISYQMPNMFSYSREGWKDKFAQAGFECLAAKKFSFQIFRKLHFRAQTIGFSLGKGAPQPSPIMSDSELTPRQFLDLTTPSSRPAGGSQVIHSLNQAARRSAAILDSVTEPILIQADSSLAAANAGFLFRLK